MQFKNLVVHLAHVRRDLVWGCSVGGFYLCIPFICSSRSSRIAWYPSIWFFVFDKSVALVIEHYMFHRDIVGPCGCHGLVRFDL